METAGRRLNLRVKIIALLTALAAFWSVAAYLAVGDTLHLLSADAAWDVGRQTSRMVGALQVERRVSVVALSGAGSAVRAELAASRGRTDELAAAWHEGATSRMVSVVGGDELAARIGSAGAALAELDQLRLGVDEGSLTPAEAGVEYTATIGTGYAVLDAVAGQEVRDFAPHAQSLVDLAVGRELLSRQDALLSAAFAAGEVSGPDISAFAQLSGARRFQLDRAAAALHPDDRARYERAASGPALTGLLTIEDRFMAEARDGAAPPVTAGQWRERMDAASAVLRQVEREAGDNALRRATPGAIGVIVRLLLAGGFGLAVVVAAVSTTVTTARRSVRRLEGLRDSAQELARRRLPLVVERLNAGERIDVAVEAPPPRHGDDKIGQVGQALHAVEETAVRTAVRQAALSRGFRDVCLSLARRTQALVHKQLYVIDEIERRQTDPDELEEIFRIDHLATRVRRNAENLIVLSGGSPGRTWRRPVTVTDVIRGAVAEVDDYTRIELLPIDDAALDGRAVGDVIHLLAELIENAASYSPANARVGVGGQRVAHGFVVEIEDRGVGMNHADLLAANATFADPPDFSQADVSQLGHYVVARLAQRHAIYVHLRPSPYGGVVAIVLIPAELLTDAGGEAGAPVPRGTAPAVATPEGSVAAPGVATPHVNGGQARALPASPGR